MLELLMGSILAYFVASGILCLYMQCSVKNVNLWVVSAEFCSKQQSHEICHCMIMLVLLIFIVFIVAIFYAFYLMCFVDCWCNITCTCTCNSVCTCPNNNLTTLGTLSSHTYRIKAGIRWMQHFFKKIYSDLEKKRFHSYRK